MLIARWWDMLLILALEVILIKLGPLNM